MEIPKKFKIGGHIYKIHFPYKFQERADAAAIHVKQTSEIMIADVDDTGNQRTLPRIYVSLIHEILHAIDYIFGNGIIEKTKNQEEDIISMLSEGILAFLIDNGYLKIDE